MSDFALPELKLVDPPGPERWLVWTALASLLVHGGLLVLILWAPLRDAMEAVAPPAIDVTLVPPPEEKPVEEAEKAEPVPVAPKAPAAAAEPPAPATAPAASEPVQEPVAEAEPPTSEATPTEATAASSAAPPAAEPAPTPLPRPASRSAETGTERPSSPSGEPVAALQAEAGAAEGDVAGSLSAAPGVEDLALGEERNAGQFYLEAMLQEPGLARAAEALKTLPRAKRLSQTCNIKALAQIGFSGEGFAPDVVMTDAYAMSTSTDTRLTATGAIFRSEDKWYGLAFDCTLSEDLTQVTAFSYRLGADVTDAVLARMGKR